MSRRQQQHLKSSLIQQCQVGQKNTAACTEWAIYRKGHAVRWAERNVDAQLCHACKMLTAHAGMLRAPGGCHAAAGWQSTARGPAGRGNAHIGQRPSAWQMLDRPAPLQPLPAPPAAAAPPPLHPPVSLQRLCMQRPLILESAVCWKV